MMLRIHKKYLQIFLYNASILLVQFSKNLHRDRQSHLIQIQKMTPVYKNGCQISDHNENIYVNTILEVIYL